MQLRRQFAKGVDAGRGDTALKRAEPRRSRVRSFVTRGLTAVLLAAFAALLALPVQAQTPDEDADASQVTDPRAETQIARAATEGAQEVPLDWGLIPDGLGAGDEFRLLFLSSAERVATSDRIGPYNRFIRDLAAAGHADVQAYSSGFRVVGCTYSVDARDNTKTTYTNSDKGVPIYWLDGFYVAADYEDFYDGSWDNEASNKDESGAGGRNTAQSENQPFTGCYSDGTGVTDGTFRTLGADGGYVTIGGLSTVGVGPIDGETTTLAVNLRPLYGLSEVFHVGSTDATLSALGVQSVEVTDDGIVLGASKVSPGFSPLRQGYVLSVGEGVDQITIHPTPSHSGATYSIFRRGERAAVDANPALPGFQIQLLSGPLTIIRVRVRAHDTVARKTYDIAVTRQPKVVPADWSLIPAGFTTGDEFRLLFLSSTKRNGGSHNLSVFDTFIKNLAGAGHPDIQAYKAEFKVVGCTDSTDANEHTGTIYTPAVRGVPIYWLNGNKVADDYADFYDGNWDDEANDKNENGENGFDTSLPNNYPYTGCDHDGTASPTTVGLGNTLGYPWVRVGQPNDSAANAGPLSSDKAFAGQNPPPGTVNHPFYGLSETFVVGSTDDDVTDLKLQDPDGAAIELTPTFASGTTDYTASVLYEVDVVTVIPTLSHSHATYEIQDGVGTVLYDADSNADGFQVALGYYKANTINVVVTAQDVSHTQTYTVVVAREPLTVPDTWSLLPPGLVRGDWFRVLFLSSEKIGHLSSDISRYNRFIRETAAAGHTDLQPYSSLFRAVGCTEDIDARDNTYTNTNYTTGNLGFPIYWLGGAKVADDYEDFYDGSWDDEVNDTDETGADGPDTSIAENYPLTGCDHDGTEDFFGGDSVALGSGGFVRLGRPNYNFDDNSPIGSQFAADLPGDENPMYGLSEVFELLSGDATLIDLALKDDLNTDIPLTPAFDSETTFYNARVATSVTEVTIIPTVNESHATYEFWSSFSGRLLPDENPNKNGFQRRIRNNRANIDVVVTAEHRATTITYRVRITSGATPVLDVWSLTPPGLVADEEFRLLFLSSTKHDGSSSDIADYNTFISDLVAVGHDDIQEYSSGFRAVGCTADVNARLNTTTTYTSTETGVPIYWLGGAKAADDYEDFYDGSWDDEANDKDESGANGPDTSLVSNYPLTGCDHDGTEAFTSGDVSRALGNGNIVRVARPNDSRSDNGPLSSTLAFPETDTLLMYGLSEIFRVVSTDATLSDLAVEDNAGTAITLTPTFTSGTTDYTAFVVNSVDEVTVIPTVNEGHATYEILDGSGTPLEDADPNEGDFQVALSEGPNTFKVEVTAQDEAYTQTYTVVVTRTSPVTISADRTSAIYGEDGVDFTLTRLGAVDDYLTVSVNLTQTDAYLAAASLSQTVVFAPGSATEELNIQDSQFRRLASGTVAGKGALTATVAEGVGYTVGTPNSAAVDIIIAATIGFGELSYTVSEEAGSPLTFTVVVRTGEGAPQPDATISVGLGTFMTGSATSPEDYQTLSEDLDFLPSDFTADGTVYEARKSIEIPIIDDDIADSGETFLIRLQFAPGLLDKYWYNFVDSTGQRCGSTCVVTATITDTDPGVTVSKTALAVVEGHATGASYTVVLNTQPTADVTVTVAGHAGTDATPNPTTLTFTSMTWATAQTVNVTAGEDSDTVNDTVSLTHSSTSTDSDYDAITIAGVVVTVIDNDAGPGVTVSKTALTVTEGYLTGESYTVILNTQPTADVTVTVAGHAGTDVTPTPATLTFTSTTWATAQTVTVTAGEDDDEVNDTVSLTHSAASTDTAYDGITIAGVTVTVTDNDISVVTVSADMAEANGNLDRVMFDLPWPSYTVSRTGSIARSLTVDLNVPSNPYISQSSFTVTIPEGARSAQLEFGDSYFNQASVAGTLTVEVVESASFLEGPPASISITRIEPAITLEIEDGTTFQVSESAGTVTFTLVARTAAGLPAPSRGWETEPGFGLSWGLETVPVSPGATDGSDFVGFSGISPVIGAWVAHDDHFRHVATYDLEILDDMIAEPEEELSLSLGASTLPLPWSSYLDRNCPDVSCLHTVTITDDDTAGITVFEAALTIQEGSSDTYTVVLDTQPAGDVTVTVAGADGTDLSLDKTTLTFTTTTWSTAQEVTVTAVDDDLAEGEESFTITHTVTSLSDSNYNGTTAGSVAVTIKDPPGVTVSETGLTIVEGSSDTYTVVLNSQPAGTVTVTVSGHAGTDASLDKTTLTFTTTTWSTAQEVTVTAGQDADAEDETDVTLSHTVASTADANYNGIAAGSVTVSITDNDTEGVTVSETGLTIVEGSNDTYTVVLNTQPAGTVTVTVSGHAGTDASLDKTTLTFTTTTWSTAQEVTVTAGQDADAEDETDVTLSHTVASTADAAYNGIAAGSVTVSITDNDTEGVTVSETGLTIVEGSSDTYTVVLDTQPAGTVTVTVSGHAGTDASLDKTTLTFTTTTWSTAQEVTVTAGQDADAEDETDVTLSHAVSSSADAAYNGIAAGSVTVSINDNDTEGVTVSETGLTIVEGSSGTYTVVLNTQPAGTVTVTVSGHAGTDASLDKTTLTFTTTTWSTAQEVTVTAGQDADAEDETDVTLSHAVSSSADAAYNGIAAGSVTVSITDNDTEGVTVSETGLTIVEGSSGTYTVVLDTQPAGTVTVTVNDPLDNTDVTTDPASLTFTTTDWGTAQEVTVTAGQDADAVDETATITHTVSGYGTVTTADDVAVTVEDDAPGSLTVNFKEAAYTAAEGGTVDVVVALDKDPERTITVPLNHAPQGGATTADYSGVPTSVTFNSGDTEKTFSFAAASDSVDDDGESVKLTFGTMPTGVSAGTTNESVVSITDDDVPAVTVSYEQATYTVAEGSSVTVKVQLDVAPERTVTVPINHAPQGGATAADYSGVPTSVTFNSGDTEKTFSFAAASDSADDDGESVKLTFGTMPTGVSAGTTNESVVSITDDDVPAVTVSYEQATYTVAEGSSVTVKVQLDVAPERTVTVPINHAPQGGATAADYSGVPTSVTFNSGDTEKTFSFAAASDSVDDDGESVKLTFGTMPTGVSAGTTNESVVSITDDDVPAVTVSYEQATYTVAEGSSVTVKVQLDVAPERTVTVPINHAPQGGATAADYSGVPTSVTFNSGDTEKTFSFAAASDSADDDGESVKLTFGTMPTGVSAGTTNESVVSITDDDVPAVTVSYEQATYTVAEGSSVTVKVQLDVAPERTVTVPINHAPQGGATAADYSGVPTSVTFNSGDTEKTFSFAAASDSVDDDGESVKLTFGTMPTGVSAGTTNESVVSITDDDVPAVTVSYEQATYTVAEGSSVTVKVQLDVAPERTVTVPINHAPQGGATAADYSGVPTSVTFNSGDTEKTFSFAAASDSADDDGESVKLTFGTMPTGVSAGTTNESVVSITDDDVPAVTVSYEQATYTVAEGSSVTVKVQLDVAPERTVTVPINHAPQGGATAADYSGVPTSVTFNSGDTEKTFSFAAASDSADDDGESVKLTFGTMPTGVSAGTTNESVVSITDDDVPAVTVSYEQATYTVAEGSSVTVTVLLGSPAPGQVYIPLTDEGQGVVSITDDDVPAVTVSYEQATYTVAEGSSVTVKVQLARPRATGPECRKA